ncbi:MAG: hypothetical protein HC894_13230 [Microcoleus sp. SM1_3_4]|nr:hypothetical protein [Microcoleus sp. SM1_3_4]
MRKAWAKHSGIKILDFFRNYRPNDSPLQTYSIGSRISTVNCQLSTINCQLP